MTSDVMQAQTLVICLESAHEDFIIYLYDIAQIESAANIAQQAIDTWFDHYELVGDDTLVEYVTSQLNKNTIKHDIYYNANAYK